MSPSPTEADLDKSAPVVSAMFDDIARTYDTLNHALSGNQDRRWRRRAVRLLSPRDGETVLDVCCGTGDLSLELQHQQARCRVIGTDFSTQMLRIAQRKTQSQFLQYTAGDALRLPFADAVFDAVTVAFGVRNFQDTEVGMCELMRVLKPGGRILVLEFMRPNARALQWFFSMFNRVLAPIGRRVSGHNSAYKYLPQSVSGFYTRSEFTLLMRRTGARDVRSFNFSGGVSTAFVARKA